MQEARDAIKVASSHCADQVKINQLLLQLHEREAGLGLINEAAQTLLGLLERIDTAQRLETISQICTRSQGRHKVHYIPITITNDYFPLVRVSHPLFRFAATFAMRWTMQVFRQILFAVEFRWHFKSVVNNLLYQLVPLLEVTSSKNPLIGSTTAKSDAVHTLDDVQEKQLGKDHVNKPFIATKLQEKAELYRRWLTRVFKQVFFVALGSTHCLCLRAGSEEHC